MDNMFYIVTPTLNAERYLDETITSVLQQVGNFRIRYHIQDGNSSDSTVAVLERWHERLSRKEVAIGCNGVEFSFASSADQGMYAAINQAFDLVVKGDDGLMSWINADDRFAQGAFGAALAVSQTCQFSFFVGGRHAHCDETGALTYLSDPQVASRRTLLAGLHDNRHLSVVMQEGTFWSPRLWAAAGGLSTGLRLAGDFDLWRRFAAFAQFVSVDNVLAVHRRHPEQLSADLGAYYVEVDRTLGARQINLREKEWLECCQAAWSREKSASVGYVGKVARWNMSQSGWIIEDKLLFPYGASSLLGTVHPDGVRVPARLIPAKGFGGREGPYDQWNLPTYVCWIAEQRCEFELSRPVRGAVEVLLLCRNPTTPVVAKFRAGANESRPISIPTTTEQRDFLVRSRLSIAERTSRLILEMQSKVPRNAWILFVNGWVDVDFNGFKRQSLLSSFRKRLGGRGGQ